MSGGMEDRTSWQAHLGRVTEAQHYREQAAYERERAERAEQDKETLAGALHELATVTIPALERQRDRALAALRECVDALDSVTHRGNLEADIEQALATRRRARAVLAELEGDHPYTVNVILHDAEPYPCVICGKFRQEHA